MSTPAEVAALRANTGLTGDTSVYSDVDLGVLIDAAGSVEAASAVVWRQLAGEYSKLVDVKEAGAEHKFGTLAERAMKMASFYEERSVTPVTVPRTAPRTIPITRI